jgi:hypothetical protein
MHRVGRMWTDQDPHHLVLRPEEDPRIGRVAVLMFLLAAIAATAVTIFLIALR